MAPAKDKVERLRVQVLCLTVAVITLPALWMWTQSAHSSSLFGVALGIVFFNPWLLETT